MQLTDFINVHMAAIHAVYRRYLAAIAARHPDEEKSRLLHGKLRSLWEGLCLGSPSSTPYFGDGWGAPQSLARGDFEKLKGIELLDFERSIPALEKVVAVRDEANYWFNYDGLHNSEAARTNAGHLKFLRELLMALNRVAAKVSEEEGIHIPIGKTFW